MVIKCIEDGGTRLDAFCPLDQMWIGKAVSIASETPDVEIRQPIQTRFVLAQDTKMCTGIKAQ